MVNTVRIKRRLTGAPGAPASLENAELAMNEVDQTLYYGVGTGGAGGSATSILAVGGPGAFVDKSSDQAIGGNKTFSNVPVVGTMTNTDNSTKAASTAFVKGQGYLTTNQNITVSGDATGSGTTAIALTLANSGVTAGTYPKVTVDAKGRATAGAPLVAADIPTLTASKVSDFDAQVRSSRLDQMAAPTAAVGFNSQRASGLADPTSAQDAATKNYVDLAVQGLDPKASVKAASTANIASLSGTMTIDGIALVAGDRVLVKDQTTTAQNGIYIVAATAWARSDDMSIWSEIPNAYVFAEQGTTNADNGFLCTSDQGGVLGSTAITFVQFSGAGQIIAGTGLTKNGNQIDVGTASSARIVVNADNIDLATTGITAGTYKSITVDAYGRATAGTNPTTLAGYGITDAQAKITATGLLKGSGAGSVGAAVAGTDYQAAITATGLLKGDGAGGVTAAIAGTDYMTPASGIDGGTF